MKFFSNSTTGVCFYQNSTPLPLVNERDYYNVDVNVSTTLMLTDDIDTVFWLGGEHYPAVDDDRAIVRLQNQAVHTDLAESSKGHNSEVLVVRAQTSTAWESNAYFFVINAQ